MARAALNLVPTGYDEAVAGFAPLTDDMIAEQTDPGSFSRGRGYFRSHHIFGAIRRGNTLRARCHGSSGGPYLVEATLATADQPTANNPVSFACNCPRGGFCKHVVALLLTWVNAPQSFQVRPPLAEVLASKSQEQLIALIELLLREHPDLENLLDLPVAVAGPLGDEPIDEDAIRRQIEAAFRDSSGHDDYDSYHGYRRYDDYREYGGFDDEGNGEGAEVAGKLEPLSDLIDAYAEAGFWRNALAVGATFVEEVAPRLEFIDDEGGALDALLARADERLAECLDAQDELPRKQRLPDLDRKRLIDAILTIWQANLDAGGLNISVAGPDAIARGASSEEQRMIGDWLRKSLKSARGGDAETAWQQRSRIGFLSLLHGEAGLSDEELLTEYRNAELWDDAARLLVQLDRVDEAIALARRQLTAGNVHGLVSFTDHLIATGDPRWIEQAISLIDDQLWEHEGENPSADETLRAWLQRRYAEHGRPENALEMARARFDAGPAYLTYDAVKTAALLPGQPDDPWPSLRPLLIATFRKRGDWSVLIEIHLAEGEVAEALQALKDAETADRDGKEAWRYGWAMVRLDHYTRVATAAEPEFPDEAIAIYRRLAENRIAARQRNAYREAATYLARVKNVLEANDRAEEWSRLIAELRQQFKNLRALREELDALGLV
jgi:hypothetical protein